MKAINIIRIDDITPGKKQKTIHKSAIVDAIQWTGENIEELKEFLHECDIETGEWSETEKISDISIIKNNLYVACQCEDDRIEYHMIGRTKNKTWIVKDGNNTVRQPSERVEKQLIFISNAKKNKCQKAILSSSIGDAIQWTGVNFEEVKKLVQGADFASYDDDYEESTNNHKSIGTMDIIMSLIQPIYAERSQIEYTGWWVQRREDFPCDAIRIYSNDDFLSEFKSITYEHIDTGYNLPKKQSSLPKNFGQIS